MKIRGERECQACGTRWSYFETGSVSCPNCESLRSVGVDERRLHTDSPVEPNLARFQARAAETDPAEVAGELSDVLREYLRKRGFVSGGELVPLDDTYLAARELLEAIDVYERRTRTRRPDEGERLYVLELLGGVEAGERPSVDAVPPGMTAARGLAYATAVGDYRDDVASYLDDNPDPDARRTLGALRDRVKRVEALGGEVDPSEAETLVRAARDLGGYLRGNDEAALAAAADRLASADGR